MFEGGQGNLYVYVGNNPSMYRDPNGLEFLVTIVERGSKSQNGFNAEMTVSKDGRDIYTGAANTWPNPNQPSPGIDNGLWPATYSGTGHRGTSEGININNRKAITTLGPNSEYKPQPGAHLANGVNIHEGGGSTGGGPRRRGSQGCVTYPKGDKPFKGLDEGEKGNRKSYSEERPYTSMKAKRTSLVKYLVCVALFASATEALAEDFVVTKKASELEMKVRSCNNGDWPLDTTSSQELYSMLDFLHKKRKKEDSCNSALQIELFEKLLKEPKVIMDELLQLPRKLQEIVLGELSLVHFDSHSSVYLFAQLSEKPGYNELANMFIDFVFKNAISSENLDKNSILDGLKKRKQVPLRGKECTIVSAYPLVAVPKKNEFGHVTQDSFSDGETGIKILDIDENKFTAKVERTKLKNAKVNSMQAKEVGYIDLSSLKKCFYPTPLPTQFCTLQSEDLEVVVDVLGENGNRILEIPNGTQNVKTVAVKKDGMVEVDLSRVHKSEFKLPNTKQRLFIHKSKFARCD